MGSIGPLPLRGPLPNLLPQAVRCKGPLDHLQTAHEGAKMPIPPKCLTDLRNNRCDGDGHIF